MNFKKYLFFILFPILLIQYPISVVHSTASWEIDKTTVVNWVIDGDTFNTTSGDRIRLADINAPEYGEPGYESARDLLISLVYNKQVYLDVDDISVTDPYGRLVCVAFVDYNSTHVVNVNKALLDANVAIIMNYTNNEFDPYTWDHYILKAVVPEFPNITVLGGLLLTFGIAIVLFKKKYRTI